MKKYTITLGGWYQRTTLHLSEVHGFFESGYSKLPISKDKLQELYHNLRLKDVNREADFFEYIQAETVDGIIINYFEDGLYILQLESDDIKESRLLLQDYFDQKFEPAINYLFSLGAPTPKILANIKSKHPTVVTTHLDSLKPFRYSPDLFGKAYEVIETDHAQVYKSTECIVIALKNKNRKLLDEIVSMQIFFREFKDQLEKYLHIHRIIWEDISSIKEKREIKGHEVEEYRIKLDEYQKTVDLITNRINQMGSYSLTRASIAKQHKIDRTLNDLFSYRFEVLEDTLLYIKDIWAMTDKYLKTATQTIVEIKNQSASRNIVSLQVITTAGVVAALYGHLSRADFPHITPIGALYFAMLLSLTWLINYFIMNLYKNKKYKIGIPDKAKL